MLNTKRAVIDKITLQKIGNKQVGELNLLAKKEEDLNEKEDKAFRKFFFIGEDMFDRTPLILAAIVHEQWEAGTMLIKKGDDGDKMYVIMSGVFEVLNDGTPEFYGTEEECQVYIDNLSE